MGQTDWIKELVRAEQQMEETGMIDVDAGFDPNKTLNDGTIDFVHKLRHRFVDYSSVFNQLKGAAVGGIKVYGISKTVADFMLFRNGIKLIVSISHPGRVGIRIQTQMSGIVPENETSTEDALEARWGAFGELVWTHKEIPVNREHLVKFYFSKFVKESAR